MNRSAAWLVVIIVLSTFLVGTAGWLYTNLAVQRGTQNFCHLITTLDVAYQSQPPTDPTMREVADNIHELRKNLHCSKDV